MTDVICLGEMLIDFVSTESGVTLIEAPAFKKAPGGAPANVAVGIARLGLSAAFMGQVGDDDFGRFLALTLEEAGVDTSTMSFSAGARTALAFVSVKLDGDREFMFYRHPSADMLYKPEQVDAEAIRKAKVFHYGSITLIDDPVKSATLKALEIADEAGLIISYDPNLRLSLWPDEASAKAGMLLGWPHANLIKVSAEELVFLSGLEDEAAAAKKLWTDNLKLLLVTDGPRGCRYFTRDFSGSLPAYAVKVVDTTGAGDGFMAGAIYQYLKDPGILADQAKLEQALQFANAVGAQTTTIRGAIPALPTLAEVEKLLAGGKLAEG